MNTRLFIKKYSMGCALVLAVSNPTPLLADIGDAVPRVGESVSGAGSWMYEKTTEKGNVLVNSVVEEFGKSLVNNINKYIFNGYFAPRFNRYFTKTVAPYAFDMAEPLTEYRHDLSGLILDPGTRNQVHAFVKNLRLADRKNEGLPRMILYGAPGTGKTEIARRLVNEGGFDMRPMTGGELARMTPDNLKHLMTYINKPRKKKIILFIDEAETLFKEGFGRRSPQLQNFIAATGSRSENFTVICATNFVEQFDEAAYRRFDYKVRISLPREEQRIDLFNYFLKRHLRDSPRVKNGPELLKDEKFVKQFLEASDGLSPADIENVVELIVSQADHPKFGSGEITKKDVLFNIDDLQHKKNELVAQREAANRKKREDARDQYYSDQLEKKYRGIDDDDVGDQKDGKED